MLSAMFTGVSGMNANGTALSVVSDNIANMNTTGFKSSRASFGDVLSQSIGGSQVGGGVYLNSVSPSFSQGSFESSTNVLDMAVDGSGFFMADSSVGTRYYTRAGEFHIDRTGLVVNSDGYELQAYDATTNVLGNVNLGALNSPPDDTDNITMSANLNSTATVGSVFAIADPTGTSNYSTSISAYDSLGIAHNLNVYFTKLAAPANTWTWNAVSPTSEVTSTSTSGTNAQVASGTLGFNTAGALDTESAITYYNAGGTGIDFVGAVAAQAVDFDYGTAITTDSGTGLDGTTQFGSSSVVYLQTQDGYGSGSLQSVTISSNGTITGVFTNGQSRSIAQVALTTFPAQTELTKSGGNLFTESYDSGAAVVSTPGSGSAGSILSNTLELSNVDLASEFVKMIMNQRGFQANSRIVSVSDDLLAELVNLTR